MALCVLQHAMSLLRCSASPALTHLAYLICTMHLQDVLDDRNQIPRSEVGLPDDKIVYSCSNQLYKVRIPCGGKALFCGSACQSAAMNAGFACITDCRLSAVLFLVCKI